MSVELTKRENELCAEAARSCACFNFRKASRAVTQFFDELLRPCGLRSTQLVLLMTLDLLEDPGIVELSNTLFMDRTTLTRNLKPLENSGLIKYQKGEDRRKKMIYLTRKGKVQLKKALPYWKKTQSVFVKKFGIQRWQGMVGNLSDTVNMLQDKI